MKERTRSFLIIWTLCCLGVVLITYNPKLLRDLTFEGLEVTERGTNRYMKEASAIVASWDKHGTQHKDKSEDIKASSEGTFGEDEMVTPALVTTPKPGIKPVTNDQSAMPGNICQRETRINLLRRTCKKMNLTDESIAWKRLAGYMWIVDHVHKVFYCMIPKTATHSLRYLLASNVVGKLEEHMLYPIHSYLNTTGFRFLHKVSVSEREEVLRDYFKMLVVRHPLDRLRSAYENKMREPGGLNEQVLERNVPFIEKYMKARGKLGKHENFNPMKQTLSFKDFLDMVSIDDEDFYDEHWRSSYMTCRPCTIKYDAIMRVETLDNDIKALYDHLESRGHPKPGVAHENVDKDYTPEEKMKLATDAFEKISPITVNGIMNVYEKDFKLFGYHWDRKSGATCKIHDNSGSTCC